MRSDSALGCLLVVISFIASIAMIFIGCVVGGRIATVQFESEAIERGYGEMIVGRDGSEVFRWKER